jgi:small conductance mechanosensitive channel
MKEESTIIISKLQTWYESIVEMLPNIIMALFVFILSYFFAKGVRYVFTKIIFKRWENYELKRILGKIVQLVALIIGFMFALSIVKLDKTVTSILAGVGVLGLALGFAFQDIAANFISGLFMASKKPFEIGDMIEINGVTGTVKSLNLRTTQIETFDGNDIIIPNKDVFQNPIKNFVITPYQRILINIGVSYSDNLELVKKKTLELVTTFDGIIQDKEPQLFYKEFGDSSINFEVRFWVPHGQKSKYLEYQSNAIIAIKKMFDQEGFNIPFPIRTIDLSAHTDLWKTDKSTSEK